MILSLTLSHRSFALRLWFSDSSSLSRGLGNPQQDSSSPLSRRLALTVLIGAAAVGSKVSLIDAAYDESVRHYEAVYLIHQDYDEQVEKKGKLWRRAGREEREALEIQLLGNEYMDTDLKKYKVLKQVPTKEAALYCSCDDKDLIVAEMCSDGNKCHVAWTTTPNMDIFTAEMLMTRDNLSQLPVVSSMEKLDQKLKLRRAQLRGLLPQQYQPLRLK